MGEYLAEKLNLEAIEGKAYFAMLERRGITEEEYEKEIKMEELAEKLFEIKQRALRELKKAQDSIREAHNCVAEYNTEIDFNGAEELIDMNFLDEISRKVQEVETYTRWTVDENSALQREGMRMLAQENAA